MNVIAASRALPKIDWAWIYRNGSKTFSPRSIYNWHPDSLLYYSTITAYHDPIRYIDQAVMDIMAKALIVKEQP